MVNQTAYRKKLIDSYLPLEAVSAAAAKEKGQKSKQPFLMHQWWARKPLAVARAVLWASLVDDPSERSAIFPGEQAQKAERTRLYSIFERLAWLDTNGAEGVLQEAQAELYRSMGEDLPELLDPFAGGGSIPLEAQLLGLTAYAHDLNPVSVVLNKALVELPAAFAGLAPVHPGTKDAQPGADWPGAHGLAEDIAYYGKLLGEKANQRLTDLYPPVTLEDGTSVPAEVWLWCRTVRCPNPVCGCELPLTTASELSRKPGHEFAADYLYVDDELSFKLHPGKSEKAGTMDRRGAICPHCGTRVPYEHIRARSGGRAGHFPCSLCGQYVCGADILPGGCSPARRGGC